MTGTGPVSSGPEYEVPGDLSSRRKSMTGSIGTLSLSDEPIDLHLTERAQQAVTQPFENIARADANLRQHLAEQGNEITSEKLILMTGSDGKPRVVKQIEYTRTANFAAKAAHKLGSLALGLISLGNLNRVDPFPQKGVVYSPHLTEAEQEKATTLVTTFFSLPRGEEGKPTYDCRYREERAQFTRERYASHPEEFQTTANALWWKDSEHSRFIYIPKTSTGGPDFAHSKCYSCTDGDSGQPITDLARLDRAAYHLSLSMSALSPTHLKELKQKYFKHLLSDTKLDRCLEDRLKKYAELAGTDAALDAIDTRLDDINLDLDPEEIAHLKTLKKDLKDDHKSGIIPDLILKRGEEYRDYNSPEINSQIDEAKATLKTIYDSLFCVDHGEWADPDALPYYTLSTPLTANSCAENIELEKKTLAQKTTLLAELQKQLENKELSADTIVTLMDQKNTTRVEIDHLEEKIKALENYREACTHLNDHKQNSPEWHTAHAAVLSCLGVFYHSYSNDEKPIGRLKGRAEIRNDLSASIDRFPLPSVIIHPDTKTLYVANQPTIYDASLGIYRPGGPDSGTKIEVKMPDSFWKEVEKSLKEGDMSKSFSAPPPRRATSDDVNKLPKSSPSPAQQPAETNSSSSSFSNPEYGRNDQNRAPYDPKNYDRVVPSNNSVSNPTYANDPQNVMSQSAEYAVPYAAPAQNEETTSSLTTIPTDTGGYSHLSRPRENPLPPSQTEGYSSLQRTQEPPVYAIPVPLYAIPVPLSERHRSLLDSTTSSTSMGSPLQGAEQPREGGLPTNVEGTASQETTYLDVSFAPPQQTLTQPNDHSLSNNDYYDSTESSRASSPIPPLGAQSSQQRPQAQGREGAYLQANTEEVVENANYINVEAAAATPSIAGVSHSPLSREALGNIDALLTAIDVPQTSVRAPLLQQASQQSDFDRINAETALFEIKDHQLATNEQEKEALARNLCNRGEDINKFTCILSVLPDPLFLRISANEDCCAFVAVATDLFFHKVHEESYQTDLAQLAQELATVTQSLEDTFHSSYDTYDMEVRDKIRPRRIELKNLSTQITSLLTQLQSGSFKDCVESLVKTNETKTSLASLLHRYLRMSSSLYYIAHYDTLKTDHPDWLQNFAQLGDKFNYLLGNDSLEQQETKEKLATYLTEKAKLDSSKWGSSEDFQAISHLFHVPIQSFGSVQDSQNGQWDVRCTTFGEQASTPPLCVINPRGNHFQAALTSAKSVLMQDL